MFSHDSLVMVLFPPISMATMTMFPSASLTIKNINWVEQARKLSFDAMPCHAQPVYIYINFSLQLFVVKALHNFNFIIILCQQYFKHLSIFQLLINFSSKHQNMQGSTHISNLPTVCIKMMLSCKLPTSPFNIKMPNLPKIYLYFQMHVMKSFFLSHKSINKCINQNINKQIIQQ